MIVQVEKGGSDVEADYELNHTIVEATNNRKYIRFLEFYGNKTIPLVQLKIEPIEAEWPKRYMTQILGKHHRIDDAITVCDAKKARQDMRNRLSRNQARYQSLPNY